MVSCNTAIDSTLLSGMTMYAGKSNEELASAFITNTCQLIPRASLDYFDHMHNLVASNSPVPTEYVIMCGSHAEFYIRPLITCIDDADYLIIHSDQLVFGGEFPLLPSDLSGLPEEIKCFMIEPYDSYPGFVRLRVLGHMNYNWKLKKYVFTYKTNTITYARLNLDGIVETYSFQTLESGTLISGPAIKQRSEDVTVYFPTSDYVCCLWCHKWPKEAQGWLSRHRFHGWPTTGIISEVVQSGCHLVNVQHRSCRNDKLQWRFSFSFAELILLQSWTQTQQIVYHLLRFFAKRELLQKDCPKEDEVLCTYHLKTLMLWACEEQTSEWWNTASVIAICRELLKMLAEWLEKNYCPNYFIPKANLFHKHPVSKIFEKTEKRLNEFCNSGVLCDWFLKNYIFSFIRKHVDPTGTRVSMSHFGSYISYIFENWRLNELKSLDFFFCATSGNCCRTMRPVIKLGCNSGLRRNEDIETKFKFKTLEAKARWRCRCLSTTQILGLVYYDTLLRILQTIYGLGCGEISWDSNLVLAFVKGISMQAKIVRSQYHNFPNTFTTQSSRFQFQRAQCLMENITGSNNRSEFHLLSLMAKQLLWKALKNYGSRGIVPAALAYLAAIHYASSEYEEATRLCSAVLIYQIPMEDKETLNAGCLLFIDDVVRIVGLCVLQKRITEDNLHHTNRRLYLDLRLSPDVFAQHLSVLSAERMSRRSDFYHDVSDSFFSMDVYIKSLIKLKCTFSMISRSHCNAARQIVYLRPDSLTDTEASSVNPTIDKERVLDVLMEYALENMASFYNVIRKEYGFHFKIGDCYRALYLYKCHQYDQVLHLCERILKDSDLQSDLKKFSFANVLLLPPLDTFFDRDVQSLLGFHTLFYGLSPLNDHLGKVKFSTESIFNHWFALYACIYKFELLCCLYGCYSIKYHYFLGRHFLAKYLKLRCCIDCNLPYSEALSEFAAHKTNLPFEHIICRFLLQKLRILRNK